MNKYGMEKSHQYYDIAKKIIPGGVQNARRPSSFTEDYPIFMDRGYGAHTWDVDGNEYIDWTLSFGPIVLGHCNKAVDEAVKEVMKSGFVFNLTAPMQLTLTEKLIEHIPSAETAITVTTGSEATSAAVRIARIYTGKEIIIRWGYHGWLDWCLENHLGIPQSMVDEVKTFKYNDLNSLDQVLEENKNKVACIIMMPFEYFLPKPGFLEGVRELADRHKVILIFDEIRSWPRMGLGGAQKYFGVTPDITAISKGIANGYPISAIVGKAEVMEVAAKTTISATYFPSILGMAAALATIKQLEDKNAIDHIWNMAIKLGNGLKDLLESRKVKGAVIGAPQMPFLIFGDKEEFSSYWKNWIYRKGDPGTDKDQLLTKIFYSETIKRGIFFHPRHHWYSCLEHTEDDVQKSLDASEQALDITLKSI